MQFLHMFTQLTQKQRRTYTILGALIVLLGIYFIFLHGSAVAPQESVAQLREASTMQVSTQGTTPTALAIPTADGNSFVIRTERGGSVTNTTKETQVTAGTVIAQLENAVEYAALTQAEGAYESAKAAAAGTGVGGANAQNQAVTTWRNATVAASGAIRTTIDEHYVNPRNANPGFRLQAFGEAPEFNKRRVAVEDIFLRWEKELPTVTSTNVSAKLISLLTDLRTISQLVDDIAQLAPRQTVSEFFTEENKSALVVKLQGAQSTLTSTIQSAESARTGIETNTQSSTPLGTAGVKQAYGAYQAAKSAYDKTFIRTPLSGTIISFNVTAGDVIAPGTDIALMKPDGSSTTGNSFTLPISAVKYTPDAAYVFTLDETGTVHALVIETGLVTNTNIVVTGLVGNETIITDVRGLQEGDTVTVK